MLARMWRNWITNTLLVGCKMVHPFWKTLWLFLKKRNMQLPYDPVIALPDIYSRDMKTDIHINTVYECL